MTLAAGVSDDGGPASADDAIRSLADLAQGTVSGVMLIAGSKAQSPEVSQLVPTERAMPVLNGVVQAAAVAFVDCELIEYEPATSAVQGQIMWIAMASVPLLKAIAEESVDLADMPLFDPAGSTLSNLQLAAIRAEANGSSAVFVQSLRGNQVVAQSRRVGVIIRRGVIDLPPRGQVLLFSKDVAVVIVGDIAFFNDRAAFQRLFGYLDELRAQAAATFRAVTADLRITDLDLMAAAVVGSPAMLGKMASIQRKLNQYPQYRDALTMPKLLAFVEAHPECAVEIAGVGDASQLVYRNDPQHRFKILKLLDDDYLRSDLTALEYEANSKSAPLGGG
jgi:hypothetical protein